MSFPQYFAFCRWKHCIWKPNYLLHATWDGIMFLLLTNFWAEEDWVKLFCEIMEIKLSPSCVLDTSLSALWTLHSKESWYPHLASAARKARSWNNTESWDQHPHSHESAIATAIFLYTGISFPATTAPGLLLTLCSDRPQSLCVHSQWFHAATSRKPCCFSKNPVPHYPSSWDLFPDS